MIIGIGLDVVELSRIEKIWGRYGQKFAKKILHRNELALLPEQNPVPFLAGRFAAKEAVAKALGTGISGGMGFADICVLNLASGKPEAQLFGEAARALKGLGSTNILISITHSRDTAAAMAIIES